MKQNGNDKRKGNYYIGLDVGTNSSGWAVTDHDYNLRKFNGRMMWGARLFEAAETAADRRTARSARRRLARRKGRLLLLEGLFNDEINKVDPNFFARMHESNLWPEDKTDKSCRYALFDDLTYTDKQYMTQYPTVYHLRSELVHSKEPHDIRLVFLALHHILKSRGHFLYENASGKNGTTLKDTIDDLDTYLNGMDASFSPADEEKFEEILTAHIGITEKKRLLKEAYGSVDEDYEDLDFASLIDLLSGASVSLTKLFKDEDLKDADIKNISLKDDLDSKADDLSDELSDRFDLIEQAAQIFDTALLNQALGTNTYISDAKVEQFNKNKEDLKLLKEFVKAQGRNVYEEIFKEHAKVKNYAAYSRYKTAERCSQEDFCKYLEKKLPSMKDSDDQNIQRIWKEIQNREFLPKLKGTVNGIIPYQLHLAELDAILDNASGYLPFLKEKDQDGLTTAEKIRSIFTFKIPYYVGPLNNASERSCAVRSDEKVFPWNFDKVVNREESARDFIEKHTSRCTYTGDHVLPLDSLIYEKYMVLNEINPLKVNGKPIEVSLKQQIYHDFFVTSKKKVTRKSIYNYLLSNGLINRNDEISGIDAKLKSTLGSYHDFEEILDKTHDEDQVEQIIKSIVIYADDHAMLKKWLKANTKGLDQNDIRHILRLKYKDWGRLSYSFLHDIYHVAEDGEASNIMDMLWNTNENLMQLMSSQYQFGKNAEKYREEHNPIKESLKDRLEAMYIAPSVRRSIWQTMRIVDEIVDIEKSAPEKIFIEMARTSSKEMQNKRTQSRKQRLSQLYESCRKQARDLYDSVDGDELYKKLQKESDQSLRRDRLYLYYVQLGRSMYTGDPINLAEALKDNSIYDIDHIFPRSRVRDDSLGNRVLVESKLNRDKTNDYPISESIRTRMHAFWSYLHDRGLISDKKYERLNRSYPLTDEELSDFVARQLTVTQQSTKALAEILHMAYPTARIIYSKAGNVFKFRQDFKLPKFRDVNDLHHAKDAYLNIVVGNVYATKFTDQFFKNIHNENYSLNKVFDFNTPGAWHKDGTSISTVRKYMGKFNPIVTFAPYEQKGAFFDLQIMPKGKGQLPVKAGYDVDRYGGYNKLVGAYYCLVEFDQKKKRVRALEPVYLLNKDLYENSPESYCRDILKLQNPVIIVKKILNSALLELDHKRIMITGRTGKNNVFKHAYQFAINDEKAAYLKYCSKYINLCKVTKKELPVTDYDRISRQGNIDMYNWFIDRLSSGVYHRLFGNLLNDLHECRDKFTALSELEQCKLLLEILKAFKCDRQNSNISVLNGKKNAGIIAHSSNLSNCESAYLVNQSVTGLFERKVNLLE